MGIAIYDDMGWTALYTAIEREFEVRVKLLVGSDADLYAKARETCNSDDDSDDSGNVQAEWNHSIKTRYDTYLQG